MAKRPNTRRLLAQNFLKNERLVRRLVCLSSITRVDTVYEIGPGRGIITAELARVAREVIAIEKDSRLACALRERFRAHANVRIVEKDFLHFKLPPGGEYKIFANIPFNATAAIVRKLLETPATDTYLIMQNEPARKFAGIPAETLFSLLAKPWFEFRILHRLHSTDFHPAPDAKSVLLHIQRRRKPFIERKDSCRYRSFVTYGFSRWKPNLRSAFKNVFTHKQWKRLARDLRFPPDATPMQLTFDQWLGLYDAFNRFARFAESPTS